ncbi:hypothetical protein AP1_0392 [Aeromonas phage AP1]|nr:hypothetical protein AP1_0392 [Aeromonas phage AP1]
MLVESLSVGVVCLGLAYGLDKFLGTGIFSWKEKTPSKLMRSNADPGLKRRTAFIKPMFPS